MPTIKRYPITGDDDSHFEVIVGDSTETLDILPYIHFTEGWFIEPKRITKAFEAIRKAEAKYDEVSKAKDILYKCKKCSKIFSKKKLISNDGSLWCPECDSSTVKFEKIVKPEINGVSNLVILFLSIGLMSVIFTIIFCTIPVISLIIAPVWLIFIEYYHHRDISWDYRLFLLKWFHVGLICLASLIRLFLNLIEGGLI